MMSGLKKKSRRTFEIFWNHMKMKRKPPKSLRHIETVLREKLLTLSAYIKKIRKSTNNNHASQQFGKTKTNQTQSQ